MRWALGLSILQEPQCTPGSVLLWVWALGKVPYTALPDGTCYPLTVLLCNPMRWLPLSEISRLLGTPSNCHPRPHWTQIVLESFSCLSVMLLCTHKLFSRTLVCQFYQSWYCHQWLHIAVNRDLLCCTDLRESMRNCEETCTIQSLVYHEGLNPAAPNQTFALHNSETASNILWCSFVEQRIC